MIPIFKKKNNPSIYAIPQLENISLKDLLDNSGGGSAEAILPKHVICINPDSDIVVGKCYRTFAEAKTYMESHNGEKFYVELHSGEVNEEITLSEQWVIHGNNTIITTPVKTNMIAVTSDEFAEIGRNEIGMKDCVITAGLEGESNPQETEIPIFRLFNCTLNGTIHNSMKIAMFFSCVIDCEIDTAEKTETSYQIFAFYLNCELKRVGKIFSSLMINSTIDYIIDCLYINLFNCATQYIRGFEGIPTIHCGHLRINGGSLNRAIIEFFGTEKMKSLVESCCFEPYRLNANTTKAHSIEFKSSYFKNEYVDGNFSMLTFNSCDVDFWGGVTSIPKAKVIRQYNCSTVPLQ